MRRVSCIVVLVGLIAACSSNPSSEDLFSNNPSQPPHNTNPDNGSGVDGSTDVQPTEDSGSDSSVDTPMDAAVVDAGCVSESDSDFCASYSSVCGAVMGLDNCSVQRTVASCGSCKATEACNAGQCSVIPCVPNTDSVLCMSAGKTCGTISVVDNCGTLRSPNCGMCPAANVCLANTCCVPETDPSFCARLGDNCGSVSASDNCGTSRTANCGVCAANGTCTNNKCVACVPKTCGALSCGTISDGCGGVITCNGCASSNTCIANVCSPNVIDHGGRVMATMNLYAIYWGPGFSATTSSLYELFLAGLGGSQYATINAQYLRGSANNITYVSSYTDTVNPIPVSVVDNDLRVEIDRVIAAGSLPYDSNGFYIVLTPKTTSVCNGAACSCAVFCGYHNFYTDHLGRPVVYAAVPSAAACPGSCSEEITDASSPNGNVEADGGVSILAHEIMEAQSDATLNAWFDGANPANEVGDKCSWNFGATTLLPNGSKVNQSWNGKSWLIQENWSNATSSCQQ